MRENLVIDTSTLVNAFQDPNSLEAKALEEGFEEYQLVQSADTFSEISEVLMREKFDDLPGRDEFLQELAERSEFVEITHQTDACRHQSDNKFLELAVSANAVHIISNDRDLWEMNVYKGIDIDEPRDFLDHHYERMMDDGRTL